MTFLNNYSWNEDKAEGVISTMAFNFFWEGSTINSIYWWPSNFPELLIFRLCWPSLPLPGSMLDPPRTIINAQILAAGEGGEGKGKYGNLPKKNARIVGKQSHKIFDRQSPVILKSPSFNPVSFSSFSYEDKSRHWLSEVSRVWTKSNKTGHTFWV